MSRREPSSIHITSVFRKGLSGFGKHPSTLLIHSAYLMAVPTSVLLVRQATENFWANLLLWLLGLVLGLSLIHI